MPNAVGTREAYPILARMQSYTDGTEESGSYSLGCVKIHSKLKNLKSFPVALVILSPGAG